MSSIDSFWLGVWEIVATIGFLIVIVGVIVEGVEHFKKFPRKDHDQKLRIEKLGWFLVVVGLAMEFLGDHAAKRISDRESARLTKAASNANLAAEQLVSTNLILRGELAGLEKEVAEQGYAVFPRRIRNQRDSVQALTNWAGVKVKIFSASTNEESRELRSDISGLLSIAKWVTLQQSAISNPIVRAVRIGLNTNGMRLDEIEKSEEAADALRKELNKNGITAFIGMNVVSGGNFPMDNVPQGCVFVAIGDRLPILVDRYFRQYFQTNRPNFTAP